MHTCTGGAFCCCLFFPQGLLGGAAVAARLREVPQQTKIPPHTFPVLSYPSKSSSR